jgi:hypothetical protein
MSKLAGCVDGIGLIGPGLAGWPAARAVLRAEAAYIDAPVVVAAPTALPPAERRRTGLIVRLSLAVGFEAVAASGLDASGLVSVFSSSGADGDNCHAICETLAGTDRQISPTRFHNSVHNAPSGYWGIATGAMAPSTSICTYDATFGAGLLEAVSQANAFDRPVLLVACDTPYPEPLNSAAVAGQLRRGNGRGAAALGANAGPHRTRCGTRRGDRDGRPTAGSAASARSGGARVAAAGRLGA